MNLNFSAVKAGTLHLYEKVVDFINTVNITNFKIIFVCVLAGLTAIKVLFLTKLGGVLMDSTLIIWCGFLLSMAGVAAWAYGKKRTTSAEMKDLEPTITDDGGTK